MADDGRRPRGGILRLAGARGLVSKGLAADRGDLWDSGRTNGEADEDTRYSGAPLVSSQRVFWKVRVWDRAGRPSGWSAQAEWTMGLLAPTDWRGAWIAAPGASESLLLRRELTVRPGLSRAVVHVSGLGHYVLKFDGTKAGDGYLTPGWTDYARTTLYDTYEVTSLLPAGRRAVGLLLGNGIYHVDRRGRFLKLTDDFGPLQAILHLRLEYADGTVEFVGTDGSWRTAPGPITTGNAYAGEDWDARREPAGWTAPGFDDRMWARAAAVAPAGRALKGLSRGSEPLQVTGTRRPVKQWTLPDGSTVYDLGQNASTMPRIRVSGPAGGTIRLCPAELVDFQGTPDPRSMGMGPGNGYAWWQYTKGTDREEEWMPQFCYLGCRYLQVRSFGPGAQPSPTDPTGDPGPPAAGAPALVSLEGCVVHAGVAPVGSFACSNELLNRIHELVRWAQRSNIVSVLTDCPHREKLGWLEQYHLNGPSLRYEFNLDRLFTKATFDMADAQRADGSVPEIAPQYLTFQPPWEMFNSAAEWGAAFILVPWQQYEFTGDPGLLAANYDRHRRYFAYLESRARDGILAEGLGDWYDIGPGAPGMGKLTPPEVTATAFYHEDARILAREAELLGKRNEAADYATRAERIRSAFNHRFFHADTGTYGSGSQCANSLALALGLAAPADRPRVLAALVRDIESRGDALTAGDVGFRYVLRALAEGGRSDIIYRIVNQDRTPGYGYQLRQGATSLTEAWDANPRASQNHFMLGQIMEWFYRDLAGIGWDPEAPGFRHIVIRPHPVGDLRWVAAHYDSARGPISVRWEREAGTLQLKIAIPTNATATVYVPSVAGEVTEEGVRAASRPGVAFLRREGDRDVYEIGSGDYGFLSQY